MKKIIYTDKAPAPIGPYNQAILTGNTLYTSGQIAINPLSGELVLDSIEAETVQVMENIKAIITQAGYEMSMVIKCTIFLKDMSDFANVNKVYGEYFTENPPARETVAVLGLPKGARVEISAVVGR